MIHAKLISGGAELQALFFHECSNIEVACETVKGEEEALSRVEIHNRNYMVKTLINWLKQRNYAMQMGSGLNADAPRYLLTEMECRRFASYRVVGRFIREKMGLFNKCVPGQKSDHFKHYLKEIKPILDFCS